MESIITRYKETIAERKDIENAIAEAEDMRATADYNIMMGTLLDPREEAE